MKRIVMGLLLVVTLLISATAMAVTEYVEILTLKNPEGATYLGGGAFAIESIAGKTSLDCFALVENETGMTLTARDPQIVIVEGGKVIFAIPANVIQPMVVPDGGMLLVTAGLTYPGKIPEGAQIAVDFDLARADDPRELVRVSECELRASQYGESVRIVYDAAKLPDGKYEAIFIASDKDGWLIFADSKDFRGGQAQEVTVAIEDREVLAMREAGKELRKAYVIIYAK